jgi:5-methylcytosine-specific restriction endonuclease McrA
MNAPRSHVEELLLQPPRGLSTPATDPLTLPVLVLNRLFQPVRITTVRRAILLLYSGTAQALDGDGELHDWLRWRILPVRDGVDDHLQLIQGHVRIPRVVHLRRYARCRQPTVRLTRRNVMLRDGFRCQYCARRAPVAELDIDHVIPRSRGGEDSWDNLVTACQPCNRRKGWRNPLEASMPLLSRPGPPRWSHAVQLLVGTPGRYKEWEPFLKAG